MSKPPLEDKEPVDFRSKISPEALEYDYFKHVGVVALVILGGMLTLTASSVAGRVSKIAIVGIALLAASAAIVSFFCQTEVVRRAADPARKRGIDRHGARVLLGLFLAGCAVFLAMIVDAM